MVNSRITISVHSPDKMERFFFFLSGILISVPFTFFFEILAGTLTAIMSQFNAQLWSIAIVAPLVEEFAKAYPLFYRHGETDKSIFTLGMLVGLGFGMAEYLLYVFVYGADMLLRLPGVFFHAASTSIVAYGIASKKPLYFYLIAVFFHFANNFSTLFGDLWLVMGTGSIALTYIISAYLYRGLKNKYY